MLNSKMMIKLAPKLSRTIVALLARCAVLRLRRAFYVYVALVAIDYIIPMGQFAINVLFKPFN